MVGEHRLDRQVQFAGVGKMRQQGIRHHAHARRQALPAPIVHDDLAPTGVVQAGQQQLELAAAQVGQGMVQAGLDDASAGQGQGDQGLFLLLPLVPHRLQLADNALAAARAAGVKHIVRSSGAGADADSPVSLAQLQGRIDANIVASGIAHTPLRPSGFMQNWITFTAAQVKAGTVHAPHGNGAQSVIDARDIADAAAAVLTNPAAHAGKVYKLTGAEALTEAQMPAAISAATGRTVQYVDVPESAAQQAMLEMGLPATLTDWFLSLNHVIKQGWAAGVTDDVRHLTGHAPRRLNSGSRAPICGLSCSMPPPLSCP